VVRRNEEILAQVLSMNKAQLTQFLSDISPETADYLDIILEKAEKNPSQLMKYVESQE
jgi:DNA-directed RNA polymerase subunit F